MSHNTGNIGKADAKWERRVCEVKLTAGKPGSLMCMNEALVRYSPHQSTGQQLNRSTDDDAKDKWGFPLSLGRPLECGRHMVLLRKGQRRQVGQRVEDDTVSLEVMLPFCHCTLRGL